LIESLHGSRCRIKIFLHNFICSTFQYTKQFRCNLKLSMQTTWSKPIQKIL